MRVRVLTESLRFQYCRDIGEPWLCTNADITGRDPSDCGGQAEIEVGKTILCRRCAADLLSCLNDAVEMVDLADRASWDTEK